MNVFNEFHKIVKRLQTEQVKYVLIGGVALAFHSQPRFTKDIDILTEEAELEKSAEILAENGYLPSDDTLSYRSGLNMKRFWKVEDCDEMIIDVLMGTTPRH